jgi:hypothetical protein
MGALLHCVMPVQVGVVRPLFRSSSFMVARHGSSLELPLCGLKDFTSALHIGWPSSTSPSAALVMCGPTQGRRMFCGSVG